MIYPTIGSLALFLRPYVVYYSHNNINICVYIVIIVVIKSQFIIYDQLNLLEIIFEIIFSFQIQEISPRKSSCRDFVGQYPTSPGGLPHHLSPALPLDTTSPLVHPVWRLIWKKNTNKKLISVHKIFIYIAAEVSLVYELHQKKLRRYAE